MRAMSLLKFRSNWLNWIGERSNYIEDVSTSRDLVADDMRMITAIQEWPGRRLVCSVKVSGRLHELDLAKKNEAGAHAPTSRHPCRNVRIIVRDREGNRI